jgi:hypothetical protein
MPRATTATKPQRFELETCPGAFVVIRRMNYGEHLTSRELATTMTGSRKGEASLSMGIRSSTLFNFTHAVVDHNLEDEDGRKLDLSQQSDLNSLDPVVAEELENLIDQVNSRLSEDAALPLLQNSEKSSSDGEAVTSKS